MIVVSRAPGHQTFGFQCRLPLYGWCHYQWPPPPLQRMLRLCTAVLTTSSTVVLGAGALKQPACCIQWLHLGAYGRMKCTHIFALQQEAR